MKHLELLLAATFAFAASTLASPAQAACPEYNGTYRCQLSRGTKDLNLATRVENGFYVYNVYGHDITADGVKRPGPFGGMLTTTCTEDVVRLVQTSRNQPMPECKTKLATRMKIITRWKPIAGGLREHNTVDLLCSDGSTVRQDKAFNCPLL